MNKIRTVMDKAQDTMTEIGAKAILAATNAVGKAMNTKAGRYALIVPMAVSACTECQGRQHDKCGNPQR